MLTKQNKMAIETVAPDHTYLLSLVNKPYQLDRSTTVTNILGLISDLKKAD